MGTRRGLLIVNADDLGLRPDVTDATLKVFAAGAISSATAMTMMQDTARAASLATERGLPVGLHLNLTFGYNGPGVPVAIRERQARLVVYFGSRVARNVYDPRMRRVIDAAINDQLVAFHDAFGRPPTHLDGHHHIHLCPTVALSAALSGFTRARVTASGPPAPRLGVRRALAAIDNAILRRRFLTPDRFIAFPAVGVVGARRGPERRGRGHDPPCVRRRTPRAPRAPVGGAARGVSGGLVRRSIAVGPARADRTGTRTGRY